MKATNDKNISNNFPKNLSQLSTGDSQKLARESENALHNKNEKTKNKNDLNVDQKTSFNNNTPNLNDENFIPDEEEENLNNFDLSNFPKKGRSVPLPEGAQEIYDQLDDYYGKDQWPSFFRWDAIYEKHNNRFCKWKRNILNEKIEEVFDKNEKKNFLNQIKKITGDNNITKLKFDFLKQTKKKKIDLKFTSTFLAKSPYEIYFEDSAKNKELMKLLLSRDFEFVEFLTTPLHELFDDYLESTQYKEFFEKDEIKYSDEIFIDNYLKLYEIFAQNFVFYFMNTLPNKQRSSKKAKPFEK
jgi:hypothetical protein